MQDKQLIKKISLKMDLLSPNENNNFLSDRFSLFFVPQKVFK
jgi:hypothetical protein